MSNLFVLQGGRRFSVFISDIHFTGRYTHTRFVLGEICVTYSFKLFFVLLEQSLLYTEELFLFLPVTLL